MKDNLKRLAEAMLYSLIFIINSICLITTIVFGDMYISIKEIPNAKYWVLFGITILLTGVMCILTYKMYNNHNRWGINSEGE